MAKAEVRLTIGRLAKAAGVNVETVRYYQRRGLLRQPPRPLGGVRSYSRQDVAKIAFIKSAQRLGFTLDQTGQLLRLDAGMQCTEAATLAAEHLIDVRKRLRDLARIAAALSELLDQCGHRAGRVACPLIAALHAGSNRSESP